MKCSMNMPFQSETEEGANAIAQAQALEAGYRVTTGDASDGDLAGKSWWTLFRPGWSEIEVCPEEFCSEGEAWADAIRAHKAEITQDSSTLTTVPNFGMRFQCPTTEQCGTS